MGYFQVRYDSRVINYDSRGFTGLQFDKTGPTKKIGSYLCTL